MAFGKPPEIKPLRVTPNVEAQLWKAYVDSEQTCSDAWQTKWGWILNEYDKLRGQMNEATKNSVMIPPRGKVLPPETRTTKPLPNSTAHEVGSLAGRPEFRLEKYGPDVYTGMPFVSLSGV